MCAFVYVRCARLVRFEFCLSGLNQGEVQVPNCHVSAADSAKCNREPQLTRVQGSVEASVSVKTGLGDLDMTHAAFFQTAGMSSWSYAIC